MEYLTLQVVTIEVGTKRNIYKRFNDLKQRTLNNNSCICKMKIINTKTGELIDEYKRL